MFENFDWATFLTTYGATLMTLLTALIGLIKTTGKTKNVYKLGDEIKRETITANEVVASLKEQLEKTVGLLMFLHERLDAIEQFNKIAEEKRTKWEQLNAIVKKEEFDLNGDGEVTDQELDIVLAKLREQLKKSKKLED